MFVRCLHKFQTKHDPSYTLMNTSSLKEMKQHENHRGCRDGPEVQSAFAQLFLFVV